MPEAYVPEAYVPVPYPPQSCAPAPRPPEPEPREPWGAPGPEPSQQSQLPAPRGFGGGAHGWLAGQSGLRSTVRQELVARQLAEEFAEQAAVAPGAGGLRVLDAGCGQGTQALRLARAGHRVTGLDPDPVTLGAAQAAAAGEPPEVRSRVRLVQAEAGDCGRLFDPGTFDAVLCHGVLMHLADPEPLLAALARMLAPGGLLSLLVRNGDALALRPARAGDWTGVLAAFDSPYYTSSLGPVCRADRLADLTRTLAELHVPLRRWYGVRVFTDHLPPAAPLPADGRQLAQLLAAEERAARQDPYRGVAGLLHLVGSRPQPGGTAAGLPAQRSG